MWRCVQPVASSTWWSVCICEGSLNQNYYTEADSQRAPGSSFSDSWTCLQIWWSLPWPVSEVELHRQVGLTRSPPCTMCYTISFALQVSTSCKHATSHLKLTLRSPGAGLTPVVVGLPFTTPDTHQSANMVLRGADSRGRSTLQIGFWGK